jgi:hypothetical protein
VRQMGSRRHRCAGDAQFVPRDGRFAMRRQSCPT